MFLRNIGIYLQVHAALLLRKPASTSSPSWEPQLSCVRGVPPRLDVEGV
jgi:hypothetical protein